MEPRYNFQDIFLNPYELKELRSFEKTPVLDNCYNRILEDCGLVDKSAMVIMPDGTPCEDGPCLYTLSDFGQRYLEYLRRRRCATVRNFILTQIIPFATLLVTLIPLFRSCAAA